LVFSQFYREVNFTESLISLLILSGGILLAGQWKGLSEIAFCNKNFLRLLVPLVLVILLILHFLCGKSIILLKETIPSPLLILGFILWKETLPTLILSLLTVLTGAKIMILCTLIIRNFRIILLFSIIFIIVTASRHDQVEYIKSTLGTTASLLVVPSPALPVPQYNSDKITAPMRGIESNLFFLTIEKMTLSERLFGRGLGFSLPVPEGLYGKHPFTRKSPSGQEIALENIRYLHNSIHYLVLKIGLVGTVAYLILFGWLSLRSIKLTRRDFVDIKGYLFGLLGLTAWLILYMGVVNLTMGFIFLMVVHWCVEKRGERAQ